MFVNWEEVQQALYPLKDYEDMSRRFQIAFSYPFVREIFNFSIPELMNYTQQLLSGDSRNRYSEYLLILASTMTQIHAAGVRDILDLTTHIKTREQLERFTEESRINPREMAHLLKYLVYWCVPMEKYLSGLVQEDPAITKAVKVLRGCAIRTNLDILQRGRTVIGRKELAGASLLPETVILDLVNRADLSRLPWASKATISNIIGAGYPSLAYLANANPEQLFADFFRYGKAIGKNLKLGNEIENSYRIAKIVPKIVESG